MQEKDVYEIVLERTGLFDLSEEIQDIEDEIAEMGEPSPADVDDVVD